MNHKINRRRSNIRKKKLSSSTPFGMSCLLLLIGVFSINGMLFYPPGVHAQATTGTTHNKVAPAKLTLYFDFSWTSGDPFQTNAPPDFFPSPPPPLGTTNRYINADLESFGIDYEYKVTVQPSSSGVKTNQMQISEAGASTVQNYYTNGTTLPPVSTNTTGIYNITNGIGDTVGAGTPADPILFAFDDPGPPMAITQDIANHQNVLKNVTTIQLTSTPQLLMNGSYQNAGNSVTETFRYVCTYYTNADGGEPTSSTTNAWSGSPQWFGSHSP